MKSFKLCLVLLAFVVCVVVGDRALYVRNCHTYTPATKPATETRPACPPGHSSHGHGHGHGHGHSNHNHGSRNHHQGHELPEGHVYGRPTGTASIIMEFEAVLDQHKEMVINDLKSMDSSVRAAKFAELITALRNKTALPTWLNDHCKDYLKTLNAVHTMRFRQNLEEEVHVNRIQ